MSGRIVLITLAVLVLLLVLGAVVVALVARRRREEDARLEAEHRPLDPGVIRCFPVGHPRAGEPMDDGDVARGS